MNRYDICNIIFYILPYIKLVCAARFEVAAVPAAERDGSRVALVAVHRDGNLSLCGGRGVSICLNAHLPFSL